MYICGNITVTTLLQLLISHVYSHGAINMTAIVWNNIAWQNGVIHTLHNITSQLIENPS